MADTITASVLTNRHDAAVSLLASDDQHERGEVTGAYTHQHHHAA